MRKQAEKSGDVQKTVLLVIDVQNDLFRKSTPVFRAEEMISNINALAEKGHLAGVPVVYIQHCGHKQLLKGTDGWQLHPDLHPGPEDWRVTKENSNSFEDTDLAERLGSHGIDHVVATGLVTHGCVKNTCLGGLKEGFKITLAADAHSNFSKDAPMLIRKWHSILVEKGVVVLDTADITFV